MKSHGVYLRDAEKRILEGELLTGEALAFYKDIFGYQEKYFDLYKDISLPDQLIRGEGMPLVDAGAVVPGQVLSSKLLEGLAALLVIMKGHYGGMNFDPIMQWFSESNGSIGKMTEILLKRDQASLQSAAVELKIGADELIFILVNWLKPFFITINEKFGSRVGEEEWYESSCPVCGYYPDMEKIMESVEGKKYLHCALCEFEWIYKRISCSICGNEDNETLGFFIEEKKTPYRIDYCDVCKGYIKTVRMSKFQDLETFDLTVENILTAYLDSWAMNRGYSRP